MTSNPYDFEVPSMISYDATVSSSKTARSELLINAKLAGKPGRVSGVMYICMQECT